MRSETISDCECQRCGHKWVPRKRATPVTCPNCRSPYWAKPKGTTNPSVGQSTIEIAEVQIDRANDAPVHSIDAHLHANRGSVFMPAKSAKYLAVIGVAFLMAAGIWYFSRTSPNPRTEEIQGAIGQRAVERDGQVNEAEVNVTPGSAPVAVQEFLKSKEFRKVASNQGFQSLVSNQAFQSLAANQAFQQLVSNAAFQAMVANQAFQALTANQAFQSLVANQAYQRLNGNQAFQSLVGNQAFQSLVSNQAFQSLLANQAFQSLVSNRAFQNLVGNQAFQNLVSNQALQSLVSNQGFQNLVSMQNGLSYMKAEMQTNFRSE
jgi:hypothetical protein